MEPIAFITLVLGLGISAQWLAWRFRLPSILLLLAFGFAASLLLDVSIDDHMDEDLLLSAVGLCVAIILFEGGLTLKFSELKESGAPVLRLCTIGAAIAFVLTTAVGIYALDFDWRVAALMGSILVVTGPTVIAPLLRHINPSRKIGSIVKWEGIVVDPIGAILAVFVYQAALAGNVEEAKQSILHSLGMTVLVGVIFAIILAKIIEFLLKKHLIPDFLHSAFMLSVIALAYAGSNAIQHESGLLTVTVLGIALANQKSVSVKHILEFKENLRVLIISVLFIVLSGRIETASLMETAWHGLILLFFLIVVVRPISIFLATIFSKKVNFKERLFLSALAPRGIVAAAVTSIFALEMEHAADLGKLSPAVAEQAKTLVPLVFIVIIGTVAFYGLLAAPFANYLRLAAKNPRGVLFAGASDWTRLIAKSLHEDGHDVLMLDTNYSQVASASLKGIPAKRLNILSEYVEEELDMTGLGQLVTATPNDEINSLAAKEFAHIFGSADIWQVAPKDDNAHHTTSVAGHMRGRICFPGRPTHDALNKLVQDGYTIRSTTLSEQYTYIDFLELHGPESVLLFIDHPEKGLRPACDDMKPPKTGCKVYALAKSLRAIPNSKNDKDQSSETLESLTPSTEEPETIS